MTVPNVVGMSQSEAEALLSSKGLQADAHTVPSDQTEGTVVAQSPNADELVDTQTVVRINIATGPQPVGVPDVLGRSYSDALATLQGLGFAVRRIDVQSNEPAETVLDQAPSANSAAPKGSTVTLKVSEGPTTTAVPDVTDLDQDTATATLRSAGFQVVVQQRDTTDPAAGRRRPDADAERGQAGDHRLDGDDRRRGADHADHRDDADDAHDDDDHHHRHRRPR